MSGLWKRIGSAFERTDIAAADERHDASPDVAEAVRPTATRYAPIREAVERRVNAFLRTDLVSHLEIGHNEVFLLHYIEIDADEQGAAMLAHFLHEFSPEARVQWVRKLLGSAVGRHVSVEQFLGLDKSFAAEVLAETDPFEEALNQAATPMYRVILHGRWIPLSAEQPEDAPHEERIAGPCLRLSVQDAGGNSVTDIEQFPAVLGSSVHADVEISGYYVSARHCTLHWEDEQLALADHSTNGTWVDGKRVRRGQRVILANGALLGFGRDKGESEYDRYPAIHAQLMRKPVAPGASATPVAASRATPVAPARPMHAEGENTLPLAILAIHDASGSPRREVLRLPFTIGRGSAQDYVVPDVNQGVSREHLVIEDITPAGAMILNRAVARNGTSAGSQSLPERFLWRFGEDIVLGEKWTNAPVVRLSLRQAEAPV